MALDLYRVWTAWHEAAGEAESCLTALTALTRTVATWDEGCFVNWGNTGSGR
jgi:hypothetical protein